jgi:hypothetical protein
MLITKDKGLTHKGSNHPNQGHDDSGCSGEITELLVFAACDKEGGKQDESEYGEQRTRD